MKTKIKSGSISIILLMLFFSAKANAIDPIKHFVVKGTVIDQSTKKGLEYATVKLLSLPDSSLVTGSISDENGFFELDLETDGKYLLEVHFIGYDIFTQEFTLTEENSKLDLGTIKIHPSSKNIDEVVIKGNKNAMDYQIDKKVLHVSKQFADVSGTAVDLL